MDEAHSSPCRADVLPAAQRAGVSLIELLAVIPMLAATLMATYALYNVAVQEPGAHRQPRSD